MKKIKRKELANRVNVMSQRFKLLYPHLYESVGGRYVHKVLKGVFEPALKHSKA